jgi:predicted glycoside hydrolase/deacetylase ChbG (UPF0249 family)
MKLAIRGDDYGYTVAYNVGAIKSMEDGITTHADIMLDCPGTVDGLERLKSYPWISLGWHAHFWGAPVLPPEKVPSMVNAEGRFKFGRRRDLAAEVKYDEALAECRAQIERCIKILGRVPDTTGVRENGNEFERARKDICDEYGIVYNFFYKYDTHKERPDEFPDEKYKHLGITMASQFSTGYKAMESKDWNVRRTYDPVKYFLEDEDNILKQTINISAWHPGYLDDYIVAESSYTDARPLDVKALCSPVLKQWIIDNKVELVNFRDALYGTREYQNHLKQVGSPLALK